MSRVPRIPGATSLALVVVLAGAWCDFASDGLAAEVRFEITDASSGRPVAARVYLERIDDGSLHFVRSASKTAAVPYEKQNRMSARSIEKHTTVPPGPFSAELPPGQYRLTVERGKEYFPLGHEFAIGDEPAADGPLTVNLPLRRWIDMAALGWYSGETHIHRALDELPVVLQAEDLNVALPLTYWVTRAFTAPAAGDRNVGGEIPDRLIVVDPTHVIWPRNTEYEIFTVGEQRHTLGAVFVLNHRSVFDRGVPPWGPVAEQARAEGALLDMDKLDWPFAMTLPDATGATLYELANNHLWRTEFAFRGWNSPAPAFLQPPRGGNSGGERDWLGYTLGMYYTLLDAGFRLVPTAGTASGVHPVPAGFSRVYVQLPEGFSYERWLDGLRRGRSFVTTGPMLFAQAEDAAGLPAESGGVGPEGRDPGATFRHATGPVKLRVAGTAKSEHPLAFLEVVVNGRVAKTMFAANRAGGSGERESPFSVDVPLESSGWLCVRTFEERPDGRVRFAHTAPWWVEIEGRPLRPRREEREYLVGRMEAEIERSRAILPPAALAEYAAALERFEQLEALPDDHAAARPARDDVDLRFWLENTVWHHRFSRAELQAALRIDPAALDEALTRFNISDATRPAPPAAAPLRVLPYPGGRHPRTGFLDGALDPQRETKLSVFTPWDEASYVVADVPEAIFSNLGLTYLAHTHVPTLWSKQGVTLPPLEWNRRDDGSLDVERRLPNGIVFGAKAVPAVDAVRMELWLRNGTSQPLSGLRVQNCVMLKGATGFHAQTNHNKLLAAPFAACHDEAGKRWIITAWEPCQRAWANAPCPCLHSDPQFPDCPPGETRRVHGWLSFYEGADIRGELDRIERTWERERSAVAPAP
ncbi:MAG TPA: CehA/McbA family metallohydrolase [Planctomycetaceae bacterium]|nr:CehA/McbA family metallohydrolase [Planctomycetaceae bacterium]